MDYWVQMVLEKSSIFNILMGILKPDFGKIIIENDDVTNFPIYLRAKKYKIGYVPHNTVGIFMT